MMTPDTLATESAIDSLTSQDQDRVAEIVERCLVALENGQPFSIDELVASHPDLAKPLRECLAGLQTLHDAISPSRETTPNHPLLPVNGRLGDFELQRMVGRGGMGVVYAARQVSLDRLVALKVLATSCFSHPKQIKRFLLEAQSAANLHHPHIVPVYSIGESDGNFYYAMQLIEGKTLEHYGWDLTQENPLHHLLDVFITLGEAFQYAHECGVIHRDIKPSNLLVSDHGHVWITDFGLARRVQEQGLTVTGELVGTANYMSPEQARSLPVDIRTDIYSLGIILYEMVTGRQAFTAETQRKVLQLVETTEPVRPRRIKPDVPVDLETIILKSIAKDREDRYESFTALVDDLKAVRRGRPIRGTRPGVTKRITRWINTHRSVTLTALVGIGACALILAISASKLWVANQKMLAALHESERHHRSAQENYWKARGLLSDWHRTVFHELEQLPGAEPIRSTILSDTIAHYESYLAAETQDTQLPSDLRHAKLQLAAAYREAGNVDASLGLYREVIETSGLSPSDGNTSRDTKVRTAEKLQWLVALNDYSLLLAEMGDTTTAIEYLRNAIKECGSEGEFVNGNEDKLVILATLNVNLYQAELNGSHNKPDLTKLEIAERCLRRAIALNPQKRELNSELAAVYDHQALCLIESDLPSATKLAALAIDHHRLAIGEQDRSLARHLRLQASTHNFAVMKFKAGELNESKNTLQASIQDLNELMHWAPSHSQVQKLLFENYCALGMVESQAKNWASSATAFQHAIEAMHDVLSGAALESYSECQIELANSIVRFSQARHQLNEPGRLGFGSDEIESLKKLLEPTPNPEASRSERAAIEQAILALDAFSATNHEPQLDRGLGS